MEPRHDGRLPIETGRPQVQGQAVFADPHLVRSAEQGRRFRPSSAEKGLRRTPSLSGASRAPRPKAPASAT